MKQQIITRFATILGAACILVSGLWISTTSHSTAGTTSAHTGIALPVGTPTLKIEILEEGIYEIDHADLVAAGFTPSAINPTHLILMQNGEAVPYQFIETVANSQFDSGEKIRFYGWPFDGSWEEEQYTRYNVFWLWENSSAGARISSGNASSGGSTVNTHIADLHFEVDDYFSSTQIRQDNWDLYGVEPDTMFWRELDLARTSQPQISATFDITLPHISSAGSNVVITGSLVVEGTSLGSSSEQSQAQMEVNGSGSVATFDALGSSSAGGRPFSMTQTLSRSNFPSANATVVITNVETGTFDAAVLVNAFDASYTADLDATDHQLIFNHTGNGLFDFDTGNWTSPSDVIFWDVTDPHLVEQLNSSGDNGYANQSGTRRYIAVDTSNGLKEPVATGRYVPVSLEPASGTADWIAITHADFESEANRLATHRADYSNLTTHVVDVADVYNQYGYGFPTPQAVKAYIQHAYTDWNVSPQYITLVGDGSYNPKQLPCTTCNEGAASYWFVDGSPPPSYIPFFYSFTDRYNGLIPSDYAYSLLDGSNFFPDIAVGRLSVTSAAEAANVIDKIIAYENSRLTQQAFHDDFLFLHDYDRFANEDHKEDINLSLNYIPDEFDTDILGADGPDDFVDVRNQINTRLTSDLSIINYRGHGGTNVWASYDFISTPIITQSVDPINNTTPFVTLSFECLDGNFAYPNHVNISEAFTRVEDRGSAAHFSSSGFGFAGAYNVLAQHLYTGMFSKGKLTIGDAINYGKTNYFIAQSETDAASSDLFAFILIGDPAMQLFRTSIDAEFFINDPSVGPNNTGTVEVVVRNPGAFAASDQTTIEMTLEAGLSVVDVTGISGISYSTEALSGGRTQLTITFPNGVPSDLSKLSIELSSTVDKTLSAASIDAMLSLPSFDETPIEIGKLFMPFVIR